jgi:hypothetical protein
MGSIDLFDARVAENRIVLTPVKVVPVSTSLEAIRAKVKKLGLTANDVAKAVRWARK